MALDLPLCGIGAMERVLTQTAGECLERLHRGQSVNITKCVFAVDAPWLNDYGRTSRGGCLQLLRHAASPRLARTSRLASGVLSLAVAE
jgi:hypothetical protein